MSISAQALFPPSSSLPRVKITVHHRQTGRSSGVSQTSQPCIELQRHRRLDPLRHDTDLASTTSTFDESAGGQYESQQLRRLRRRHAFVTILLSPASGALISILSLPKGLRLFLPSASALAVIPLRDTQPALFTDDWRVCLARDYPSAPLSVSPNVPLSQKAQLLLTPPN